MSQGDLIWIRMPEDHMRWLISQTDPIIAKKMVEDGPHQIDCSEEVKRWSTGKGGEAAFEYYFKLKFVDWAVGTSKENKKPDLEPIGLRVGIKTVLMNNQNHIIPKKVEWPEVMIMSNGDGLAYAILGFAPMWVLRKHQNINKVRCLGIKAAGYKTGFDTPGYDDIIHFSTIDELRILAAEDEARERSSGGMAKNEQPKTASGS
jgi:hypothetical protein